jgi:hypothetical protein
LFASDARNIHARRSERSAAAMRRRALPHARLPGEFVAEETDGKFSSLQSIEKS